MWPVDPIHSVVSACIDLWTHLTAPTCDDCGVPSHNLEMGVSFQIENHTWIPTLHYHRSTDEWSWTLDEIRLDVSRPSRYCPECMGKRRFQITSDNGAVKIRRHNETS